MKDLDQSKFILLQNMIQFALENKGWGIEGTMIAASLMVDIRDESVRRENLKNKKPAKPVAVKTK